LIGGLHLNTLSEFLGPPQIVLVRQTYYHYCEVDAETVAAFVGAPSAGKFFNSYIKGYGWDGPFDCRTRRIPEYP
jgi:hypothetical protein